MADLLKQASDTKIKLYHLDKTAGMYNLHYAVFTAGWATVLAEDTDKIAQSQQSLGDALIRLRAVNDAQIVFASAYRNGPKSEKNTG